MVFKVVSRTVVGSLSFSFVLLFIFPYLANAEDSKVFKDRYIVIPKKLPVVGENGEAELHPTMRVVKQSKGIYLVEPRTMAAGEEPAGTLVDYDPQEHSEFCSQFDGVCEPEAELKISGIPSDSEYGELWGMSKIQAPAAWDVNTGSHSVLVAVIDTGVDFDHSDLVNNMWTNTGEIAGNGIDDDQNGFVDDLHGWDFYNKAANGNDDHGHGTHCAGTIGAQGNNGIGVAGVNWNVRIMGLKFLSAIGSGSTMTAIDAIDYAIDNGAQVINASWGGTFRSDALEEAIERARQAGVIFVAASGNSANDNDTKPHYPSSYSQDNVISVAATDKDDNLTFFSNYGKTSVDIAAPGLSIFSTLWADRYAAMSGTSMAAPHVAGVAALVLSTHPGYSYQEAIGAVTGNSDTLNSLSGVVLSAGRLNAYRAITGAATTPPGGGGTTPSDVKAVRLWARNAPSPRVLLKGKRFQATFKGTPFAQFSPVLELRGLQDTSCALGTFQLSSEGRLKISGKLKGLKNGIMSFTRKVILGKLKRTAKFSHKKQEQRMTKSRFRQVAKEAESASITCELIRQSVKAN